MQYFSDYSLSKSIFCSSVNARIDGYSPSTSPNPYDAKIIGTSASLHALASPWVSPTYTAFIQSVSFHNDTDIFTL